MERTNMVNRQVITVGVTDRRLISAMLAVPRRRFVPAALKAFAYSDADLKLTEASLTSPARYLMSPGPFAQLVQAARIRQEDTVLDIGCATGYSSAVIARLVGDVVALESDGRLAASAIATLAGLAVDNVAVVTGLLEAGWPEAGPYDLIFIAGSIEEIPSCLVSQLVDGGRLVAVLGTGRSASAKLYVKNGSAFGGRAVFNIAAQPLPGFAKERTFIF